MSASLRACLRTFIADWPATYGDAPDTDYQRGYMAACEEHANSLRLLLAEEPTAHEHSRKLPADVESNYDPNHPMTAALRLLVREQHLRGAVLLSFTMDRVGVNSSSPSDIFGGAMTRLGDLILARFQRGDFDEVLEQ